MEATKLILQLEATIIQEFTFRHAQKIQYLMVRQFHDMELKSEYVKGLQVAALYMYN